ncbi:MAG: hypothetical protein NTZ44_00400 [Candidatus Nomurabacteria bacterium]|nr:hypothetical protein [Candidatus Nomurabacteria bacterium]
MINLLPLEEKDKISTEYIFRIVSFYFYVFGTCFFVASITLLPAYFFSSVRENLAIEKLQNLKDLPVTELDHETNNAIQDVNSKVSIIENAEKNKFLVLENMINEIIFKKMTDIKIMQFDYKKDKDGLKTLNLHGLAPNRERLLLFRQTLESDKMFSHIDLPISNFVKGANIDFSLNLTFL